MSERPCCGCPLCQIETELLTEFLDTSRQESCRKLLASAPELAAFPSLAPLLAHLRLCRDTASSDGILRALLQAKRTFDDGSAERIVRLAFLPHMHAAVRSVLRRYPQLSPEDTTQNVLQSLLSRFRATSGAPGLSGICHRTAHYCKRSAFEWAEHELRSLVFEADTEGLALNNSGDSFERLVLLRHFLDRAVRRGVLNGDELDLLAQFKLENGLDGDASAAHSNAHRQRQKRLVMKLRRVAAQRTARRKPW